MSVTAPAGTRRAGFCFPLRPPARRTWGCGRGTVP